MRILVCGESLVEEYVNEAGDVVFQKLGGGPYTFSRCVSQFHMDVALISSISTDETGERQMEELEDSGVDTSFVQRSDLPTGKVIIGPDASRREELYFDYHYLDTAVSDLSYKKISREAIRDYDVLHVGSLASYAEPMSNEVSMLLRVFGLAGFVTYTPNLKLVNDDNRAEIKSRVETILRNTNVVRASESDLFALYPEIRPEITAGRWTESGPVLSLITAGKLGSYVLRPGKWARLVQSFVGSTKGRREKTLGIGEVFLAAFLYQLSKLGASIGKIDLKDIDEETLLAMTRFASANAALCVGRIAEYAPDDSEVQALLKGGS